MEVLKLTPTNAGKTKSKLSGVPSSTFGAQNFRASSIACVARNEASFLNVRLGLENLGFEVACSSCLETTFRVVSEDPEEWAMVIVRLDQPLDEQTLQSYVRLIRMMEVRVPIMLMTTNSKPSHEKSYPKLIADCVVSEPQSVEELSQCLQHAVAANTRWGSSFDDFRLEAVNSLARRPIRRRRN